MMQEFRSLLVPVVAGVLCFGAGWWSGTRDRTGGAASSLPGQGEGASTWPAPRPALSADDYGGAKERPPQPPLGDLRGLLETSDHLVRERDLERLGAVDFAGGADWKRAAASIGDLVDRSFYLKGVVGAWAEVDPLAAMQYVSGLSLSSRANLVPHAVSIWTRSDPAGAEAWVMGLAAGEVRDLAIEGLFRSWAVSEPAAAAARGLALEDEAARYRALSAVVKEWSANDLKGVGEWATGLKDPNLKDFATRAAVDEMASRAPGEAMRWAAEHLAADPQANPEIIPMVASKAGFEVPEETFDWLQTLPPTPEASSSLAGVAAYLVEDDPTFTWETFPQLPDDLKRITAGSVASTLGIQNADEGKRWLADLADPAMRQWATSAFVSGWHSRDPDAAEAWIETLPPGPEREAAQQGVSSSLPGAGAGGGTP